LEAATGGGAQALGRKIGAIAVGHRADLVVLDPAHPDMLGIADDRWLDGYVFSAKAAAVDRVLVGGATVVAHGRHRNRQAISARYAGVKRRLAAGA
ncbi:MAG: amidohydrolase family protein, partial [Proteobacteria bacterium]|nr:amidohydrolase family protein [Pseudomonadota bacterium]